jgi:hypothetical protein
VKRFSPADIERIRFMADFGHSGVSIARSLNRSPQAIRVKCCELGISLRPPSADSRRFKLSPQCWHELQRVAAQRGAKPGRLARQLVELAVKDKLVDAIIDAEPPKQRQMVKPPPDPLLAALRGEPNPMPTLPTPVPLVDAFDALVPRLTCILLNNIQLRGTA